MPRRGRHLVVSCAVAGCAATKIVWWRVVLGHTLAATPLSAPALPHAPTVLTAGLLVCTTFT